eukprot:GHVR01165762.1.p1 GENE.GHVR01165762.1~~GHVR01165762.1.p1  ORF type:complete len:292 (+),score=90.82 GHVR01165762.1:127-1002(+)
MKNKTSSSSSAPTNTHTHTHTHTQISEEWLSPLSTQGALFLNRCVCSKSICVTTASSQSQGSLGTPYESLDLSVYVFKYTKHKMHRSVSVPLLSAITFTTTPLTDTIYSAVYCLSNPRATVSFNEAKALLAGTAIHHERLEALQMELQAACVFEDMTSTPNSQRKTVSTRVDGGRVYVPSRPRRVRGNIKGRSFLEKFLPPTLEAEGKDLMGMEIRVERGEIKGEGRIDAAALCPSGASSRLTSKYSHMYDTRSSWLLGAVVDQEGLEAAVVTLAAIASFSCNFQKLMAID